MGLERIAPFSSTNVRVAVVSFVAALRCGTRAGTPAARRARVTAEAQERNADCAIMWKFRDHNGV
jgi:hypothetical protein